MSLDRQRTRRWFQYGEPWGLLDKTNPDATPTSVARHSFIWGLIGAVGCVVLSYVGTWTFAYWPVKLILTSLFLAFIGGLVEWQVGDATERDLPEVLSGAASNDS